MYDTSTSIACLSRMSLIMYIKMEHNDFPQGVFLIKILTILLLGELPFSAAYEQVLLIIDGR